MENPKTPPIETPPTVSPWERLPGEPMLWYARFERYRLAGRKRSLTGIYNAERAERDKPPLKAPPRVWVLRAREWGWQERAEAWDATQLEEQREEWRERREALRQREWEAAGRLLERVEQMLQFPVTRVTRNENSNVIIIEPAEWKLRDVAHLLAAASHVGRLAAGSETDRVQVTIDDVLSSLPEEFREKVCQELAALVRNNGDS